MPGLLKRAQAARRRKPPTASPPSPAKLERLRRARWGDDLYERLCGTGNAYDGTQSIIAKAKTSGTWFDADAKKAERLRFKLNRKQTKRRVAQLERRLNGHDVEASEESSGTTARPDSTTRPSITQTERNQAMTTKTKQTTKIAAAKRTAKQPDRAKAGTGVGAWVRGFLKNKRAKGMSNGDIAQLAREKFGSATSPACVSWYRAHQD